MKAAAAHLAGRRFFVPDLRQKTLSFCLKLERAAPRA
jgi:hypothetical protein